MDNTLQTIIGLIEEKDITELKFQSDLGLYRTAVSEWKSGKSKSYERHLPKIADYFGVSVDYLLGKTDKKNNPAAESSKAILSPKQQELWELIHSLPEDLQDKATEMLRLFVESVSKGQ